MRVTIILLALALVANADRFCYSNEECGYWPGAVCNSEKKCALPGSNLTLCVDDSDCLDNKFAPVCHYTLRMCTVCSARCETDSDCGGPTAVGGCGSCHPIDKYCQGEEVLQKERDLHFVGFDGSIGWQMRCVKLHNPNPDFCNGGSVHLNDNMPDVTAGPSEANQIAKDRPGMSDKGFNIAKENGSPDNTCGHDRREEASRNKEYSIAAHSRLQDTGVAPPIHNIIGKQIGSMAGYDYSESFKRETRVWDEDTLDEFLSDHEKMFPGTKMNFRKMEDVEERIGMIREIYDMNGKEPSEEKLAAIRARTAPASPEFIKTELDIEAA